MRNISVGVFEHLEIASPMDADKRVAYTQRILRGSLLKHYRAVLVKCTQLAKELLGDKWEIGNLKRLSTDNSCVLEKKYSIG